MNKILLWPEEDSESEVAQSCLTLWDPMDCSLPGSSIHGISQARILEWVAISFSRRSSQPGNWTWVSCIVGRGFTVWATREVLWRRHAIIYQTGIDRDTATDTDELHWWLSDTEPACNAGDLGLIPGLGRSPGEGNGNPLQYSCLENPRDGGAW